MSRKLLDALQAIIEIPVGPTTATAATIERQNEEYQAMRRKAALFDVLAARIETEEWDMPVNWNMPVSEAPVAIRIRRTGERVHGATLAEAVEKAMEGEARE